MSFRSSQLSQGTCTYRRGAVWAELGIGVELILSHTEDLCQRGALEAPVMLTCLRMTNADSRLRTLSQRITMHGARLAAESVRAYLSKEDPPLAGKAFDLRPESGTFRETHSARRALLFHESRTRRWRPSLVECLNHIRLRRCSHLSAQAPSEPTDQICQSEQGHIWQNMAFKRHLKTFITIRERLSYGDGEHASASVVDTVSH